MEILELSKIKIKTRSHEERAMPNWKCRDRGIDPDGSENSLIIKDPIEIIATLKIVGPLTFDDNIRIGKFLFRPISYSKNPLESFYEVIAVFTPEEGNLPESENDFRNLGFNLIEIDSKIDWHPARGGF